MPDNECIPFYEPGSRITGHCTAAVRGKRLLRVSADIPGGPTGFETIRVAEAAAGNPCVGVAAYDQVLNEKVPIVNGPGMVVPIVASAAIAANQLVEAGADGTVVPAGTTAGAPVIGLCLSAAANGADAMVRIFI